MKVQDENAGRSSMLVVCRKISTVWKTFSTYIYVYSVLRPHIFTYLRTLTFKTTAILQLAHGKKKNVGLNKDASIGGKMTIFGVSCFAADTGRKTPVLAEKDASIGRKCQNCARVTAALK